MTGLVELKAVQAVDLIERWLKFAGVSTKSEMTYRGAIKQLLKYFTDNGIEQPTREDLVAWRDGLIAAKKSASTIRLYVTSAKLFYRFLAQENLYANIADNLKAGVKISHAHKKDVISAEAEAKLLAAVSGTTEKALRDRAILLIMLTAALRTIEFARADIGDFAYFGGECFLRVQGKGHSAKDQLVKINSRVKLTIDEYLKARASAGGDVSETAPLFVSTARCNRGARISTQVISKMVKANLRAIGIDSRRVTAHSLRATAATQMLLNGASLEQVQEVLRHASISTTMIYAQHVNRLKNNAEDLAAAALFRAAG